MSKYLTRIELHKIANHSVTEEDYDNLHTQMKARGFETTITSDDKRIYKLPTAEYRKTSNSDLTTVLAEAKAAASAVVMASSNVASFSALVVEYTSAMWHNLDEVKQAVHRN